MNIELGTDCEDIDDWVGFTDKAVSDPRHALFTPLEHQYCSSFEDPAPHYAGKWCAKEALQKALSPIRSYDLRKIEVLNKPDGAPYYSDKTLSSEYSISLSISHSRRIAFAVVALKWRQG